jgi:hypothetical protein
MQLWVGAGLLLDRRSAAVVTEVWGLPDIGKLCYQLCNKRECQYAGCGV